MPKSILFALESFLPGSSGGTELYALNLARELRKRGVEIEFITPAFEHMNSTSSKSGASMPPAGYLQSN